MLSYAYTEMHTWVQQTLSNERKINYFLASAKNPALITMLCMANRVMNYYLFCIHKRLDPRRIHTGDKKWQHFSAPLHPNSRVGLDTVKSTPHAAHENAAWTIAVLKRLRTIDPENLCQVSVQSVPTSFFIASVIGDM